MNRLKEIRKLSGLEVKELAELTGLHVHSIYNIEVGVRKTGAPTTQEKLARALGLQREDLFPQPKEDQNDTT